MVDEGLASVFGHTSLALSLLRYLLRLTSFALPPSPEKAMAVKKGYGG